MYSTQLTSAASSAATVAQADQISRMGWKQWADGNLSDSDAERLQAVVIARKTSLRTKAALPPEHPPTTLQRRLIRGPVQRQRLITRRRRTALAGVLPGALAVHFTMGEIAVLSAIGREVRRRKDHRCELSVAAIGELSGCCRSLVQTAIRQAQRLGLIAIRERPRPGLPSLTNIIVVTSLQWRAWLRLRGRAQTIRHDKVTREKGAGRSSFVLVNGEVRDSQSDPTRTLVRGLPRHERETSGKMSEGTD